MNFSEGDFVRVRLGEGCPGRPGRPHRPGEDGRYGRITNLDDGADHPITVLYRSRTAGRTTGSHEGHYSGLAGYFRADELEPAEPSAS
jgi:hypothetical protein